MKMIVTNKAPHQYSLEVPLADGAVIREIIPKGERILICDINPYDINVVKLLRNEVFKTKQLCVDFECEPDDLVGLGFQRVYDEGVLLAVGTCPEEIDFVGDGVTATTDGAGKVTVTVTGGGAGDLTADRFKFDVALAGTLNSMNRVFTTPDTFLEDKIEVFHNGDKLSKLVGTSGDYIVSESGGVGTGFDTITFVSFKPKPTSRLRALYITTA